MTDNAAFDAAFLRLEQAVAENTKFSIEALDDSIRMLRKADRWRLHKRNTTAIETLRALRKRIGGE